METPQSLVNTITAKLLDKSSNKQFVHRNTKTVFAHFKKTIQAIVDEICPALKEKDASVCIEYKENNEFEVQLSFSGDVLVFSMHTNVFTFEENHFIHTLDYVKQDPNKAFCGVIEVYNFLNDSLKYQRMSDTGYLICRIFINKENNIIIEGERPIIELNQGFDKTHICDETVRAIIEQSMLYTLDFDLWAPPIQNIKEITVQQKMASTGLTLHQTSKRLGFKFQKEL
jgi:hypothetical protein